MKQAQGSHSDQPRSRLASRAAFALPPNGRARNVPIANWTCQDSKLLRAKGAYTSSDPSTDARMQAASWLGESHAHLK